MYRLVQSSVKTNRGFTLIELLVVISIIGILAAVVITSLSSTRHSAFEARAQMEIRSFATAMQRYMARFGEYPPDESRNIPSGLEAYLSNDGWPDGPWPESVYDWDNWTIDGTPVIQLSVRFCPQGGPLSACTFPTADWADNFGVNSAYFYCFQGPCRSHENEPRNYPGYCVNCACREMETCDFSEE